MDMFWILIFIAGIMGGTYAWFWYKNKFLVKGYMIYVYYSEIVGENIIQSSTVYHAFVNEEKDILTIPKLNIKRPTPPRNVMTATFDGKKSISLIKIDNERYGYKIPSLDNHVFVYKRDEKGNIITNKKGTPVLIKHRWQFCDDIIEPDVKHWEENFIEDLRRRRLEKKNFIEKFLPYIAITMIFLFAVITLNVTTKQLTSDKQAIMERAETAQETASKTADGLNRMMDKISGTRVFDEQDEREKFLNESK